MGMGTQWKILSPKMPKELKLPVSELSGVRAGWLLVFERGRVTSRRQQLNLFRGTHSMFTGATDEEMAAWVNLGDRYQSLFSVAQDKADALAKFERDNASFVAAVKAAADWAMAN